MRTKQELLLGKHAVDLQLITKEQLRHCMLLEDKLSLPLPLVFLKEKLMDEEKLQFLLEQYWSKKNSADIENLEKGEDLVFVRLLLRDNFLSPQELGDIVAENNKSSDGSSLCEIMLKKRFLSLQKFLDIYNRLPDETIACSGCNKEFRLLNLFPGKKLRCKHCKTIFWVPSIEQEISSYQSVSIPENKEEQETFAGYEIVEEVAQGGMGIIYRAQKKTTGQIVALKVLREAYRSSPEAKKRFAREAQTLNRLKHKNIVSVLDVGIENEVPYFTMDFVEGVPLSNYVHEKELLPVKQVLDIIIKVCEGLQYAHESEVVHRDIKPSNILLDKQGEPRLTDFGLAKCMDSMTVVTRSGTTLGTPYYMSPEQAKGQMGLVGPRSDIYSLGVVFYEMLTGYNPFLGENTVDIYQNILTVEPDPPSNLNKSLHKKLDSICLKCLRKDPFQRYKNAKEMGDDLKHYLYGKKGFWEKLLGMFGFSEKS